jgi:hypothetical protein
MAVDSVGSALNVVPWGDVMHTVISLQRSGLIGTLADLGASHFRPFRHELNQRASAPYPRHRAPRIYDMTRDSHVTIEELPDEPMLAIQNSEPTPAIENQIAFIQRGPRPMEGVETTEDTTRQIQGVRAALEDQSREDMKRQKRENAAAQARANIAGTQTRPQGIISAFQALALPMPSSTEASSYSQVAAGAVGADPDVEVFYTNGALAGSQVSKGPVKGSSSSRPVLPFSKPGSQVAGLKMGNPQKMLMTNPKQYAKVMPANVVARMINSGKLRIEDVPKTKIKVKKDGPLAITDKVKRQVKHVDQKKKMDPALKTPAIGDK